MNIYGFLPPFLRAGLLALSHPYQSRTSDDGQTMNKKHSELSGSEQRKPLILSFRRQPGSHSPGKTVRLSLSLDSSSRSRQCH